VSSQGRPPRTIFEQGGHAYTAEPAARAEEGTSAPGELVQTISDQNAVNAAVLVVVAFWAVASASATINNARAGAKGAALFWALSSAGACLIDAYLVWSLV
jgi:hypothetical protein